ncbi:uncharacterized protein C8Q71DRAFT_813928 [Rhodofomes roseus]|uniref:Uncharacterized protein n=1 Tax=Rhodofomes roseus TaxID=34475 RepID=A0A4Y9YG95_9APHY|nr:uncharacterized protein C8Q71DRAFT_813928 [Rhodofomes roseus]KAH9833431.1 hypothetical protein C8Q71DRAFT_813928 [Rhodofomes roseus]TFY61375.1 hypothetical protein EVJ58_g4546 [Rhodofomes roseus]
MVSDSAIAAGVSVSLVAVLAIAVFLFWYLHRRHVHVAQSQPAKPVKRSTLLDPSHPACHVTPFGSPGEAVRFVQEPGANMRTAHQREDGGWEFTDMSPNDLSTFDLTGVVQPRNSLSGRSTLSFASTLHMGSDKKAKLLPGELTTRGYLERDMDVDIEGNPPPAYSHAHRDSIVEP